MQTEPKYETPSAFALEASPFKSADKPPQADEIPTPPQAINAPENPISDALSSDLNNLHQLKMDLYGEEEDEEPQDAKSLDSIPNPANLDPLYVAAISRNYAAFEKLLQDEIEPPEIAIDGGLGFVESLMRENHFRCLALLVLIRPDIELNMSTMGKKKQPLLLREINHFPERVTEYRELKKSYLDAAELDIPCSAEQLKMIKQNATQLLKQFDISAEDSATRFTIALLIVEIGRAENHQHIRASVKAALEVFGGSCRSSSRWKLQLKEMLSLREEAPQETQKVEAPEEPTQTKTPKLLRGQRKKANKTSKNASNAPEKPNRSDGQRDQLFLERLPIYIATRNDQIAIATNIQLSSFYVDKFNSLKKHVLDDVTAWAKQYQIHPLAITLIKKDVDTAQTYEQLDDIIRACATWFNEDMHQKMWSQRVQKPLEKWRKEQAAHAPVEDNKDDGESSGDESSDDESETKKALLENPTT